jgi:glycosyltransferase involved in cell wall biosynthesis
MRVLLISYYYSMSESTGSLRVRAMAKYLPHNGIEVAVLTYRAQKEEVVFAGNIIGVRDVTRDTVPLPVFYMMRIWQRGLRWLGVYKGFCGHWRDAALTHADEIIDRVKPDAILASYPSVEALEIGVALSEKYGLPLISDFRDGLMFEPLDPAVQRHNVVRNYYQALEARVAAASKLILTVSEPITAYFRQHYTHPDVMTLHNGFDMDDIAPDNNIALPVEIINIVHTGRLGISREETSGKGRGVDALSTALCLLLERAPEMAREFRIHFIGQLTGSEQDRLAPLVKKGVVKLWGHQSRAKALGFQRKADVLLLITAPDKASITTGKLFEYLAANKPVLALTRGTAAARIVMETGVGWVVSPDKPEEIADAIETIIRHAGKIVAVRNEAFITAFSRDSQMAALALKLKGL